MRLSMSLVGRFAARTNGRPVELRTRKAAAVLGYLALSETRQEGRERLVGLLWSRSDEEKARASLRQVVRELRSALGDAGYVGFAAGRLSVGIEARQAETDIDTILRLAEARAVHPRLLDTPRLDERLLEGMDDLDPSFRVWVLAKRQTIRERLMRHLEAGIAAADVTAETKKKIAAAIANLDPTHEQACCYLMQTHAEQGDVAGTLRLYKALWNLLDREYGMEPSPTTQELVASIKLGAFEPSSRDAAHAERRASRSRQVEDEPVRLAVRSIKPAAKPHLVLRPFAMHGITSDHVHLVQGFSLHLAASLVRFREWSVIDRPAELSLPMEVPQYCIEATAYQAGAEINMVMMLRDETTGICIWSESLRLGLDNWFDAQQRIIRRVATSLNVQLSAERLVRLAGEPDVSLDVYDRWLRGQNLMAKFDPESWRRAVSIFGDAIREHPGFSPCYSSLVQMNNVEHFVHPGTFRDRAKARETLELAKTAVQLDPVDSRAHLCCGWSYVMALREAEAAPHIELARDLNDNDPWTLLSSAAYYAFCGSVEQARLRAEESLALSPVPSRLGWGYHCIIRFLCGDYPGAVHASDQAHGVIKTLPVWRAAALYKAGNKDLAREEAARFMNGIRSFWVGPAAPTDEEIARWLLQAHPISAIERWRMLRDALGGAGLPVERIRHPPW